MNFFSFKSNNHSYDNDRIKLSVSNEKACQLTIKKLTLEDNGEWKFSIRSEAILNGTLKTYRHKVDNSRNISERPFVVIYVDNDGMVRPLVFLGPLPHLIEQLCIRHYLITQQLVDLLKMD